MKAQINIYNKMTGNIQVSLNDLKTMISERRKNALSPSIKKEFQKKVTTITTDKTNKQVAAHYTSFAINKMNIEKAISVYNAGGHQVAKLIK